MIQLDEAEELLRLVREGPSVLSDDYARMTAIAQHVVRDAQAMELSAELEVLCDLLQKDGPNPVELTARIVELAEKLAELSD